MITIEQLLESVDLDFEPRWVTKDERGYIELWDTKPHIIVDGCWGNSGWRTGVSVLKLAEFYGKRWTECIYEVPRKPTRKIKEIILTPATTKNTDMFIVNKINELVDAVNELKGAKNE